MKKIAILIGFVLLLFAFIQPIVWKLYPKSYSPNNEIQRRWDYVVHE